MPDIDFNVLAPLHRNWRNVELLRTAILNCLAAIFHNHDFCHTVGMITSELLENAMKFGLWDSGKESRFRLRVFGADDGVHVEVSNPVASQSEEVATLQQLVKRIENYSSAKEAYYARLRELAAESPGNETSRLGLVRIAYEGNCALEVVVLDGVITVKAVARP